ncbi:MAG: HDOD domain-containing protein [Candidatus Hydrogenedentes bacterium]|nr:HDOD domain-containing protein [Candidatus Hydrogenedentota bacterium]
MSTVPEQVVKRRVLFVDDEPHILQGLRRMLHPYRNEWEMSFAESAHDALGLMEKQPYDVVVTDIRMPVMDGAEFLNIVMRKYPQTIRFVLSGHCEKETIFRSVGPTHQFISKPCDADTLRSLVARAFALRDLMSSGNLKNLVSRLQTLPSLPDTYTQLMAELRSADPSIRVIGELVSRDVGMSAKILQLVNSAFFGLRNHVSSPLQAATLLGTETLRSLVLMTHVFSQVEQAKLPSSFSLEELSRHSMAVGAVAKAVVKQESGDKKLVDDSYMAGLLHDSGKLILATNQPEAYGQVLTEIAEKRISLEAAERPVFGATHAEVGAYLLGLWGLPDPIVEAVAFHHAPGQCLGQRFCPLTAVHIADVLVYELDSGSGESSEKMDMGYLEALGVQARVGAWRELGSRILQEPLR